MNGAPGGAGFSGADLAGRLLDLSHVQAMLATNPAVASSVWVALYQRWLTPAFTTDAGLGGNMAAAARFETARQRFSEIAAAVAIDASGRFAAALGNPQPDALPITTLRELFDLAVECGDAAWTVAAHREDFGAAIAELLAALGSLRREHVVP